MYLFNREKKIDFYSSLSLYVLIRVLAFHSQKGPVEFCKDMKINQQLYLVLEMFMFLLNEGFLKLGSSYNVCSVVTTWLKTQWSSRVKGLILKKEK